MSDEHGSYYVPEYSKWPIIGALALFFMGFGAAFWVNDHGIGPWLVGIGFLILCYMFFGWFGNVIRENQAGLTLSPQMQRSFRIGMLWFIFSEIMFFATFFGALFYARHFAVPWLGGKGIGEATHLLLWPNFEGTWPVLTAPNPAKFFGAKAGLDAWGTPAIATVVLLSSGVTITASHWALARSKRIWMNTWLIFTILLGSTFVALQIYEYGNILAHLDLKLDSGIYGATFYLLTGIDGAHVIMGVIMLVVILLRSFKGHFNPQHHFAFDAVTWYWHFVEFIWVVLFIFVYVM